MVSQIMNLINSSLVAVSDWFLDVFNQSGVVELYISFLFIFFAVKFILNPIFGHSRGSDRARSSKEVDSDE